MGTYVSARAKGATLVAAPGVTAGRNFSRRVGRHLLDRGRHVAARAGNARVVEQNDLALRREAIGHRRTPMVHPPSEVLVENERYAVRLTEATIGEADAVGLDELRRR